MKTLALAAFEEAVLVTVARLGNDVPIARLLNELKTRIGRAPNHGATQTTLRRLQVKGYICSRVGDSAARGGGHPFLYSLEPAGLSVLASCKETHDRLWDGLW